MSAYDLCGFRLSHISHAKILLKSLLGLQFLSRESDYQGRNYFQCRKNGGEYFLLKNNINLIGGESAEMAFHNHRILLYVNDNLQSSNLKKKIKSKTDLFDLLKQDLA